MSESRIKDIMTAGLIRIHRDESLQAALAMLDKHKISGLVVHDTAGDYVGVLSKTDIAGPKLLDYLKNPGRNLAEAKVSDFMNARAPITVQEDAPIDNAIEMMMEFKIHRVFVMNKALEMVGIVSTSDILGLMRYTCEAYL